VSSKQSKLRDAGEIQPPRPSQAGIVRRLNSDEATSPSRRPWRARSSRSSAGELTRRIKWALGGCAQAVGELGSSMPPLPMQVLVVSCACARRGRQLGDAPEGARRGPRLHLAEGGGSTGEPACRRSLQSRASQRLAPAPDWGASPSAPP
jgi:hypothetical protein